MQQEKQSLEHTIHTLNENRQSFEQTIHGLNENRALLEQHIRQESQRLAKYKGLWTVKVFKPFVKTEQAISSANRYRKGFRFWYARRAVSARHISFYAAITSKPIRLKA